MQVIRTVYNEGIEKVVMNEFERVITENDCFTYVFLPIWWVALTKMNDRSSSRDVNCWSQLSYKVQ